MPKGLVTTLWVIWLVVIWFMAMVAHGMTFDHNSLKGIAYLLGIIWLIYLAGLWFDQSRITDTAWAMLLGFAIGCIRMLDKLPNQLEYAQWLRFVPRFIVGGAALLFVLIFVCVLPLMAQKVIKVDKEKNRVLGRDY
jgi:hypothetical protein